MDHEPHEDREPPHEADRDLLDGITRDPLCLAMFLCFVFFVFIVVSVSANAGR